MESPEFRITVKDDERIAWKAPGLRQREARARYDGVRRETIEMLLRWLGENKIDERGEFAVLGSNLYEVLFDEDVDRAFREEIEKTEGGAGATPLRVILEFEMAAKELPRLPWEFLYLPNSAEERRGFFIAQREKLILSRHVPLKKELKLDPIAQPIRVLVVVSGATVDALEVPDPDPREPGRTRVEERSLGTIRSEPVIATLDRVAQASQGRIQVEIVRDATKGAFEAAFERKNGGVPPDVVHVIGHGRFRDGQGALALSREGSPKQAEWLLDSDLADILSGGRPQLRLVFLHACEGACTGSAAAFQGLAMQVAYERIPAVVAMQFEVSNNDANRFAERFYAALSESCEIDEAVQCGRNELATRTGSRNFNGRAFGSPVVFLQTHEALVLSKDVLTPQRPMPPPATTLQRCPWGCEHEVSAIARACGWCGKPMRAESCTKCGARIRDGVVCCEQCGQRIDLAKEPSRAAGEPVAFAFRAPSEPVSFAFSAPSAPSRLSPHSIRAQGAPNGGHGGNG